MNRLLLSTIACLGAALPAQDKQDTKVDFHKQIWPILEKRCVECHATAHAGPDGKMKKPKGGVTLDSKAGITASKGGKVVIAKNAKDSLLHASISLPADDEDRMPPAKKGDPLPKEQIELIQKWIDQGAEFGTWTGKAKENDKDKGDKQKDGAPPKDGGKPKDKGNDKATTRAALIGLATGLKALPQATLDAFRHGPFHVASIGDGSPLLTVSCDGTTDDVDDQALALLQPLAQHVTELDLGRTRITDAGCTTIAAMPRLTTLDLRQTAVGNHGTAALAACKELRSLNLFGTKAGDYGLAALSGLAHLEHLYVWQTDVSAAAVVRLREAVPDLRVVIAADLPEAMPAPAGGGRRRPQK